MSTYSIRKLVFLLLGIIAIPVDAQWQTNPSVNTPVSVAPGHQSSPAILRDGFGGFFIVWVDRRGADLDIYVQHFDNRGNPRWAADGLSACNSAGDQDHPVLAPDDAGGVIVVWRDGRSGVVNNLDIYAQHFDYAGNALWNINGIPLCNDTSRQSSPAMTRDGAGGAIVVWEDSRNGLMNTDIYAQRVDGAGNTLWTTNGFGVTRAGGFQQSPTTVHDGSTGAYIGWTDTRGGDVDIYATRISGTGSIVSPWLANGNPVSVATNSQENQQMLLADLGGLMLVWEDFRSGIDDNLYMQRLSPAGSPLWTTNGVQINGVAGEQVTPRLATDGADGAIVAWHDLRNGFGNADIYAQRVNAGGVVQWNPTGVPVGLSTGNQSFPRIVADGSGGAVITWSDERNGASNADIYAQRTNSAGALIWATNGLVISNASAAQDFPELIPDGAGGAVIAWRDLRGGTTTDIYVQNIGGAGILGEVALVIPLVNAPSVVQSGTPVPVSVTLPQGFQPTIMELYYRNGGESSYQQINFALAGNTLQATIPAIAANLRGIEFYTRIGTANGVITDPPVNPVLNPNVIRIEFANPLYPVSLIPKQFRMISLPAQAINPSVAAVFTDEFGGYDQRLWRVFRWESDSSREYPFIQSMLTPGNALWLVTRDGNSFGPGRSLSIDATQPRSLLLLPGWNQIANPFAFSIAWTDIIGLTPNVIGPYYFDGAQYILPAPGVLLMSWEGYFVLNNSTQPIELQLPRQENSGGIQSSLTLQHHYSIQVKATTPDSRFIDTENFLGFTSDRFEPSEIPEPPFIGDGLRLSIVEDSKKFMEIYRTGTETGSTWDLTLQSSHDHEQVTMRLVESGIIPDGFHLYLLDLDEERTHLLAGGAVVLPLHANVNRHFRLVVGTEEYAAQVSNGIPLTPVAFALDQNYPNPFNPSTTIRYQLGKRSHVVLEISNLLGQVVRTLVNDVQSTGEHAVSWDGLNEAGVGVGSGVFFYRLRTLEFTSTRRMVLLR